MFWRKVFLYESSQIMSAFSAACFGAPLRVDSTPKQFQIYRAKILKLIFSVKMTHCPKLDFGAVKLFLNALKMPRKMNLSHQDHCYCNPSICCDYDEDLADYEELRQEALSDGPYHNAKWHLDLDIQVDDSNLGFVVTRQVHRLIMDHISLSFTKFAMERALKFPVEVIDDVINFAYNRTMNLMESKLDNLLEIAHQYDIPMMKKYISRYILDSLTLANCMKNYQRARDFLCFKDLDVIKAFILKTDFLQLNQIECGFINEPNTVLETFIQDDRLGLKESEVFNLIMEWIRIAPERKLLLSHVRFGLLTDDFYQNQVIPQTKNHFEGRFHKHFLKNLPRSKKIVPRIPNEFVLAIGGWSSYNPDGPCGNIEAYNVRTQSWHKMKQPFPGKRAYHGCGVIGQKIYMFGGFDRSQVGSFYASDNWSLDLKTKQWRQETSMNTGRCYVLAAVLNDEIYAVGGFSGDTRLASAEKYNPETKQWTMLPPMSKVRSDAACVGFNGKLYVIGGFNGSEIHDSVEIYDPVRNEWTFGSPLQTPRSGVKAVVYREKIYVIGGYDGQQRLKTVEILDPSKSPRWKMNDAQLKTRRSNFTVSVIDGMILVMGGYDGFGVTNRVESFDEESNQWISRDSMKKARSALTSVTLKHYSLNFFDFI